MYSLSHKHSRESSSPSEECRVQKRPAYSEHTFAVQKEKQLGYADYSVAIVCALDFEMSAVRYMLDRQHRSLPAKEGDRNLYVLGELSGHNVVIACLPGTQGKSAAAHVAADLERTFPHIQYRLLVGIGGGVPSDKHDIRLGDVVVSMPEGQYGGVVQYDLGKDTEDGFSLKGCLLPPPRQLINAAKLMISDHHARQNRICEFIIEMTRKEPKLSTFYQRPSADSDILFRPGSRHPFDRGTCAQCNHLETVQRNLRLCSDPQIFYGLIASGDRVLKSAHKRDFIRERVGDVLCFEMEACGPVTELPYMVIRGISDYADYHKTDQWQSYAAAVAAGCAKELLSYLDIHTTPVTHLPESQGNDGASKLQRNATFTSEEKRMLDSLIYEGINLKQQHIGTPNTKTCRWLLNKNKYLDWLDSSKFKHHHGFLWIKGKPGSGKTTLMQYASIETKRQMTKGVISFFFDAQGKGLQKSTNGMYRSLLLQLHRYFSDLQAVFLTCVKIFNLDIGYPSGDYQFTTEMLKYMFREALHKLKEKSLVLFIDALDECNENEVRDMISFFRQLGDDGEAPQFQVCFSSRHHPYISIGRELSLTLEDQEEHEHAIANYVVNELNIGYDKTANEIRYLLQRKADGVFMWAVLVVGILNKEYDDGGIDKLWARLSEIPDDLHALFRSILKRDCNDSGKDALLFCIQWVLFAQRPLKPEELYFAIRSGTSPESICEWDTNNITRDAMQRFILASSQGLVETTRWYGRPTVRFIHESVKDFLLKKNGLAEILDNIDTNFRGQAHERLSTCCVNYVNTIIPAKFQSYTRITRDESIDQVYPLMEYATQYLFYHSDLAEEAGFSQKQFLENFNVSKWVLFDNAFACPEHFLEDFNVSKWVLFDTASACHRNRLKAKQHTQNVSLLYLLAEFNAPHLIKALPSVMSYFDIEEEHYGTPLFAALAMENREVIRVLLGAHAAQRRSSEHLDELYNLYCQNDGTCFKEVRSFSFSKSRGILFNLIALDDEILFQFAMDIHPKMLDEKYYEGQTPLTWAISHKYLNVIKPLLAKIGLDINEEDNVGRTALSYAAMGGHKTTVKLLIEKDGIDLNMQDPTGKTALFYAAMGGHRTTVRLLMEKDGIDANMKDHTGKTVLHYAAMSGHKTTVRFLLEKEETDVNIQNDLGLTPLSEAVSCNHSSVVKLLLATENVNVNLEDNFGDTPFSHAVKINSFEIGRLLLDSNKVDPAIVARYRLFCSRVEEHDMWDRAYLKGDRTLYKKLVKKSSLYKF